MKYENRKYLPGRNIHPGLQGTASIIEAVFCFLNKLNLLPCPAPAGNHNVQQNLPALRKTGR